MLSSFCSDIRYGARAVFGRPIFVAVVTLTLALGIGVNVAIYSLAEQALLRPLPVPEPDRLVNLTDPGLKTIGRMDQDLFPLARPSDSGGPDTVFSYPMFRDLERSQEAFVGLAAHRFFNPIVSAGEQPRPVLGVLVSGDYFSVLGLQPALGRLIGPGDDDVDGVAESVVLSYSYWQSEFNGAPNVVGRTLLVNDVPLTIVGVAPRGFRGTVLSASVAPVSVFVPITIAFSNDTAARGAGFEIPNHGRRDFYWVHLFGRLKPGVTLDAAAAGLNSLYRAILTDVDARLLLEVDDAQREAFRSRPLVLEPGAHGQSSGQILSAIRIGLGLLLVVSGLVLVLCCANVAGLILVRGTQRSGEMAVRSSIGATRGRLASLLLAESLVLALPAAVISLPVALSILKGASRLSGLPEPIPSILEAVSGLRLSAAAALVALGVALASALLVGLLPLRRLIRTEPANALKAYGTSHTDTKGVARFRAVLATAQVALSMALLATTLTFAHSLANIARVDLGIDLNSVVVASVEVPTGRSLDATDRGRIEEALSSIPGVSSAASSLYPLLAQPLTAMAAVQGVEAERQPVSVHVVGSSFFRLFGIGLLAGREFDETDIEKPVIVVSQRFAERYGFSSGDVIGRTLDFGLGPMEIVGVVTDTTTDVTGGRPQLFQPMFSSRSATFYARSAQPSEELVNAVRETITRIDPTMPITALSTMERQFSESTAVERFFAATSTAFAVLATALAALGLYGVLAYSVARRSREIGLRFALGAPSRSIRGMVLRQVAGMTAIGITLGVVAALALGSAARGLLFGVAAADLPALLAAAAMLTAVTLGAAYLPARRASRVDPKTVLRYE